MILKVLSSLAALALPAALLAQNPITADSPYQINYASNLQNGDGVVNITNGGAATNSPGRDICVNAYVYTPLEEPATCCTCLVTPNGLNSWPVYFGTGALLSNITNQTVLNEIRNNNFSVVIKLYATAANADFTCPSPASPNGAVIGMAAWGSHSHPTNTGTVAITETAFTPMTLSVPELGLLTSDCSYNLTRGSQQQCPGCRTGGLVTSLQ